MERQGIHRVFRCPRCQHVEPETVPSRSHCPRCDLTVSAQTPDRDDLEQRRRLEPSRRLRVMPQPM
jgi:hypothetical protein